MTGKIAPPSSLTWLYCLPNATYTNANWQTTLLYLWKSYLYALLFTTQKGSQNKRICAVCVHCLNNFYITLHVLCCVPSSLWPLCFVFTYLYNLLLSYFQFVNKVWEEKSCKSCIYLLWHHSMHNSPCAHISRLFLHPQVQLHFELGQP